jgi:hypothetical protein
MRMKGSQSLVTVIASQHQTGDSIRFCTEAFVHTKSYISPFGDFKSRLPAFICPAISPTNFCKVYNVSGVFLKFYDRRRLIQRIWAKRVKEPVSDDGFSSTQV